MVSLCAPFKDLALVEGGEGNVWFNRYIEGRESKINELWTFTDDEIREVDPYAQVEISDNFIRGLFTSTFSMHKKSEFFSWVADPSTGCVQLLDVTQPFGKTGVATAALTENIYTNPWSYMKIPARNPYINPIDLRIVVRRVRDDLL